MASSIDGPQLENDDFSSECASNQVVVFNSEAADKEQDELGENRSLSLQKSAVTTGHIANYWSIHCPMC